MREGHPGYTDDFDIILGKRFRVLLSTIRSFFAGLDDIASATAGVTSPIME